MNLLVLTGLQIVTTTPDLTDLAEQLVGDTVGITQLIPTATDPHQVLPKASMLIKLQRAEALISMGLGYEHAFLPALLEKIDCERHFVASDFIGTPLEIPETLDRRLGADLHPQGNPHWNTSPRRMRLVAVGLRDFLIQLHPEAEQSIRQNWKAWDEELGQKILHWETWLQPAKKKPLVTYHRSWSYFAQDFGFDLLGEVEPKPGLAPSTRHLARLSRSMQENQVKLLLMEPWYSENKLGNLAKITGIQVVKKTSGAGSEGYIEWMNSLVDSLAMSLGLPEPERAKPL
ncbi:MAG: metal ABC transporter substrate-binding protein [Planctomycetes bacterium]|nr:metal ABC transporter substrate-binding protein [Planctomycetota bacterium]